MKFTVDRSKWLRGSKDPRGEEAQAELRDFNGDMCCLGFLALECGLSVDEIDRCGDFESLSAPAARLLPAKLVSVNDDSLTCPVRHKVLTNEITQANDDHNVPWNSVERERELAELFAQAGIEVEFVG